MVGYLKAYILFPLLEKALSRNILSKINILKKDADLSFPDRLRLRRKRLADILKIAEAYVPYYREVFRKFNFKPENVEKDMAYLNALPYLNKDILREQGDRLINEKYKKACLHIRKTSGSTGPSVLIYYSQNALDWTAATNLFVLEWAGKKMHMKETHLSSRHPDTEYLNNRFKEWAKCLAMNRTNILTDDFDKKSLEDIWKKLKKAKPYLIQGHPSTLYALALFIKENNTMAAGIIKVFESTGEVLDKKKKEAIEEVFKCQVFNRYGSAEFGVVAHNTKTSGDKQKILDFIAWPETLNLANGLNEIVLTGLTNEAMPLIRYRTGDLGELEILEDGFYFKNIKGRVHDIVKIGDRNYPTHYIQDLLDKIGGVDDFQIESINANRLILRIVLSDVNAKGTIENKINTLWPEKIQLEFTDFKGLKRTGLRGKFTYLIN